MLEVASLLSAEGLTALYTSTTKLRIVTRYAIAVMLYQD